MSTEPLLTVKLSARDWRAVLRAIKWHAEADTLGPLPVAFITGREQLRHIAEEILATVPPESQEQRK